MSSRLCSIGLLLLWITSTTPATAQVILGPQGPVNPQRPLPAAGNQNDATNPPEKLVVTPAAEPRLPLQHTLYRHRSQRKPGNAAPFYYRAVQAFDAQASSQSEEFWSRYHQLTEMQLDQFPAEEVRRLLKPYEKCLEAIEIAAAREECDWGWRIEDLRGPATVNFSLPEMQGIRNCARILLLRARLELAERRFEDFLGTVRDGFQMGVDVARPPTLINDLVGVAICSIFLDQVKDFIATPGSPNIYWPLATLPYPLIDMRPAFEYEMTLPRLLLPILDHPAEKNYSQSEWLKRFRDSLDAFGAATSGPSPSRSMLSQVGMTAMVMQSYPPALEQLVKWGYDKQQLEAMPTAQVVAIHQSEIYQYAYQQTFKWALLNGSVDQSDLPDPFEKLKADGIIGGESNTQRIIPFISLLMPAVHAARNAEHRLSARIAALQTLEAVRMYAANHEGQLPKSLSDIREVRIPSGPNPAQPLQYTVDNQRALLFVPAHVAPAEWRLEISIAK